MTRKLIDIDKELLPYIVRGNIVWISWVKGTKHFNKKLRYAEYVLNKYQPETSIYKLFFESGEARFYEDDIKDAILTINN